MKSRAIFRFACAVALGCSMRPCFAQQSAVTQSAEKPRLAMLGFVNQTGDESFSIPAETASTNLFITMKMLNLFQTFEYDTVPRDLGDESLARWCARNNADFAVFGTVLRGPDGTQEYQLNYFSRAAKRVTARKLASGSSVLDVFSAVDTLTDAMLPTISDNRISFGSLKFIRTGALADYDIWLDGVFIQTNPAKFDRVPSGSHEIRVVQKATGQDALRATVVITPKKTETVQFELKDASLLPALAAGAAEAGVPEDSRILEASRQVRLLISRDLSKNYDMIAENASLLPPQDRQEIYSTFEKQTALPVLVNALILPLPVGSYMQKDVTGSIVGTAMRAGGLAASIWFVANYANNSNPGPVGLVFIGGLLSVAGGYVYGFAEPVSFAHEYNKKLKSALALAPAPNISPAVSVVPAGKSFALSLGMKAEY